MAQREEHLYVAATRAGTGVDAPDFVAVVDTRTDSHTYGRIVHETPMPYVGDELRHLGWTRDRRHLIVPGLRSSRVYVVDVAEHPLRPRIAKVVEPDEILRATGYTRPHTTHCLPDDGVVVSMLGDADGNAACGFAVLDAKTFEVKGRWETGAARPPVDCNCRTNVLVASEFGVPNAYEPAFDLADVEAGLYGRQLHVWNVDRRELEQTIDLGANGLAPLALRWKHDAAADEGFVGAALSSTLWRFHRQNGSYAAEPVVAVEPVDLDSWPIPVPGLIADLVLSPDDRALYFSNWLHGDLRRYDISDPPNPRLTGRLWLGGALGRESDAGRPLTGGPQMLQLSCDGRRLYVTNSLLSSWDDQFYPGLESYLLRVDIGEDGVPAVDPDFFVDFHDRPDGPARAREVRLQGGDCTSEIPT